MRTARALTGPRRRVGGIHTMHTPLYHVCPLLCHSCPPLPRMPPFAMHAPLHHACPPFAMHTPLAMPHAMHAPQPCTPPSATNTSQLHMPPSPCMPPSHACPPAMHTPLCHACPPAMHAPLQCTPPPSAMPTPQAMHTPQLCMPPLCHACPPINRMIDACETSLHSSRVCTAHVLTISWGVYLVPGGT